MPSSWFWFLFLCGLLIRTAAVEPPPLTPLGKPGETIYQTSVALQKPKKSADRIDGGLHHVVFSLWLPEDVPCIRGIYLMPPRAEPSSNFFSLVCAREQEPVTHFSSETLVIRQNDEKMRSRAVEVRSFWFGTPERT